jgi:hypothetical protein
MKYLILGKLYDAVKCGGETDWYEDATDENTTCGDCGCKVGEQHSMGCDIERCPACTMQLISCDCQPVYQVTKEQIKNKQFMNSAIKMQTKERQEWQEELKEFLKQKPKEESEQE